MAADAVAPLPDGFVLDAPKAALPAPAALPDGFVLDRENAATSTAATQAPASIPEGATATNPNAEKPAENSLLGSAKAIGSGLVSGTIGIAGLPGDAQQLTKSAITWLADKGGLPGLADTARNMPNIPVGPFPAPPTSAEVRAKLENVTGPLSYEPKTRTEKYLQTTASFAPAALVGPGGLTRRLVTQAIIPGAASEAAGQAAESAGYPNLSPYARIAGAVLGGAAASKAANMLEPKPPSAPTADVLKDVAGSQYEAARNSNLYIKSEPLQKWAFNVEQELNRDGLNLKTARKTIEFLQEIYARTTANRVANANDLETIRRTLGEIVSSNLGKSDATAAIRAGNALRRYTQAIPAADVISGDAAAFSNAIKDANANWSAAERLGTVGDKLYRAELRADAANSGLNIGNATRQRFVDILTSKALRRGFSADEIGQMEKIVRGTIPGNLSRRIANLLSAGGGWGQTMMTGLSGGLGFASGAGWPGAAVGGLLGQSAGNLARGLAARSTASNVEALLQMLGQRSPLYSGMLAAAPKAGPALSPAQNALLSAIVANQSSLPPPPRRELLPFENYIGR